MVWIIAFSIILGIVVYFKYLSNKESNEKEFLDVKEISFSPHAIQRIQERGISQEDVLKIIKDKNSAINYRFGNRFSLTNGEITVVLSKQFDRLVVVTVYWNRRKKTNILQNNSEGV